MKGFDKYAQNCPNLIKVDIIRRPGNALNIEIGQPQNRCAMKEPMEWPQKGMANRWVNSGGSPLVFGACSNNCPLGVKFCECGHRHESHWEHGCWVENCVCEKPEKGLSA